METPVEKKVPVVPVYTLPVLPVSHFGLPTKSFRSGKFLVSVFDFIPADL